ncbi:2-keto-4-pentenoate hydratase/2-oxohepta-3-ene-1,7-dioic acid hydratase (catechol pathway) [Chitinophaga sp. YR627]|uniref:fumarylacetoacetate hydrolase family protein n=1 Tax=Chitinophaga sp. YR627 TaxID=1881041 RepID=UPI0008ED9BC3|nr:fumarylacetoacetate hydrolase family protein [Chitinophaga sp. YR627]SFN49442.1 2-keto-4-pentenoate hydratase/2-oxohepta-3-ene-1,7-dioic acid hydratase (catechol pathway) [Chitinophaga sp. YR627]
MTRIIIGLSIGFVLTLLDIYPVYSRLLQTLERIKTTRDVAEVHNFRRNSQIIKSPEEALTISRFYQDSRVHTLAVLEDDGESVTGVDLSAALKRYDLHSFDIIMDMGFDEVVKLIGKSSEKIVVKYEELLPCVAGDQHLAIGINYAEHGKETGQVRPFMFPKYVHTDPAIHQLNYTGGWLLDHEVELGIVFPSAVCAVADLDHMMIGFLVVNDFTDRATLMRKMDSKNVTGGKGFPDAKSKKGFLPTGPYMVIPRNWRAFVTELKLQLSVNGKIRQEGAAKDMVWDIDKIIEHSLAVKGEKKSFYQDKMVVLFEGDCIPANSIIITGTPSGVVFNAPAKSFIVGTVTRYIFTGGFFKAKMHPYILRQYLKKEMTNPHYLKPGDQVESSISFLGSIKTNVKE